MNCMGRQDTLISGRCSLSKGGQPKTGVQKQGPECTSSSVNLTRRPTHSRSGPDTTAKRAPDGGLEALVAQHMLALQV